MRSGAGSLGSLTVEDEPAAAQAVKDGCEIVLISLPALPDPHGFAGCFAGIVGDLLLAAGGANFPDGVMPWRGGKKVWHDSVFGLDMAKPESGWRRLGSLTQSNGYGASVSIPQGLVMIGGGSGSEHFSKVSVLRWADGKLVQTEWPELPVARANACAAVFENQIHLLGGIETPDDTSASNRHFVLDLENVAQGWTEAAPIPGHGVMLATAAATEDGLFLMGGCSLAPGAGLNSVRVYLKTTWCYSDGVWGSAADLPRASVGAASPAWTNDGRIILVGGDDGLQIGRDPEKHTGFSHGILCYDHSKSGWSHFAEMQDGLPVTLPGVVVGDSFVLVNGEIRPGVRTPAVLKLRIFKS